MDISLSATGSSDWTSDVKKSLVRFWGTWTGTAAIECREVGYTTEISQVAEIADTDASHLFELPHVPGIDLEWRVTFTKTTGTLEGRIGG